MVQRQVAEQQLVLADGRERGSAGESLGDEVERGEGDPLLAAGAPGGEEDGGRAVQAEAGQRIEEPPYLVGAQARRLLAEDEGAGAAEARGGVEEDGLQRP